MEIVQLLINFILHIDEYLGELISTYGILVNAFLFFIIFIETGLVIMPFLPGDSLLFAAGAFAALGSLNIFAVLALLSLAAILGDTVNYWIGHFFGQKLIDNPRIPINKNHVDETNKFFEKHGGKTIILARFVPIVRTFAPFVAGLCKMTYPKFISYNVIGGITWVFAFTLLGFLFGNLPEIKHNFTYVIFAIIAISILPMIYQGLKAKFKK